MSLPPAIASSIRRTELSRATASGMNEFGNSTVSRSGRTGSSAGTVSGRSPAETLLETRGARHCSLMRDPPFGRTGDGSGSDRSRPEPTPEWSDGTQAPSHRRSLGRRDAVDR